MATWADLLNYKQYVVRSDGAKFLDGVRNDLLDTSWLTISPTVSLGPGLYDELMVLPRVADEDEIKAWAQAGAPWYDPSPVIPDAQIPSAGVWNRKVRTYYQATAPTAEGIGDIWFDTGDGIRPRWWDGSQWVDAHDKLPIDVTERPINLEGAGGYMEFDQQGFRAHRYSDNKRVWDFDVNTGNATFAGELQAATGTFAGDLSASKVMAGIMKAGGITADYIKSINADLATITAANGKVVIGDISGKQWQGSPLPAGTFGLWAPDGFIATTQTHVLQVADATGYQTTSTSYVDLANFAATFALKRKATVIINVTMQGGVGLDSAYGHAAYRLTINGNPIPETVVWGSANSSGAFRDKWFPVATHTMQSLPAGTHSVGVQFARGTSAYRAIIANRVMTILVLYG